MFLAGTQQPLPYAGGEISYDLTGSRWTCTLRWEVMKADLYASLLGMIGLLGSGNNFLSMGIWGSKPIAGGITGSPTATGAALARSITINSGGGSNPALARGDIVQIGDYAYAATQNLTLTAGTGSLSIWPELRVAASSAPLITASPKTLWKLLRNQEISKERSRDGFQAVELPLVEALP
jgi:hypothetical protein